MNFDCSCGDLIQCPGNVGLDACRKPFGVFSSDAQNKTR